jgi:hypothetical protein
VITVVVVVVGDRNLLVVEAVDFNSSMKLCHDPL